MIYDILGYNKALQILRRYKTEFPKYLSGYVNIMEKGPLYISMLRFSYHI